MIVTRKKVSEKMVAYLRQRITLSQLVNWAEEVMMDCAIDDQYADEITYAVSRLGVADVKAFGLTWEDSQKLLRKLGYEIKIDVQMVA